MGGLAEALHMWLKDKNPFFCVTVGEAETSGVWFVVIEVCMTYNIVLVLAVQHNGLISVYIAK